MLDFIIIFGAGALSLCIAKKTSQTTDTFSIKDIILSTVLGYVDFSFVYMLLRFFKINPVVKTEYTTYISTGFHTIGSFLIVAVITGFIYSFIIKRVEIESMCEKIDEESK